MKINLLFLSLSMVLLFSCNDKNSTSQPQPYEKGIFVLNEGSFGNGNASVSFIDADTKAVSNDMPLASASALAASANPSSVKLMTQSFPRL